MMTRPLAPGASVPTCSISGQSPFPISGADSGRWGTLSRLMNVTVTGWSRWLSTGFTPAAVIVTVGSVRACDGSSSGFVGETPLDPEPQAIKTTAAVTEMLRNAHVALNSIRLSKEVSAEIG
jgi:hypothetical protein